MVAGLIGAVALLVTATGCSGSGGSSEDDMPEAAKTALAEHPGYTHASDDGRAVLKVMTGGQEGYPECTAKSCEVVQALAPVGCSSLYVGADVINGSGDVVAQVSSSAAALPVDGEAIIQLTSEIPSPDKWEITSILCR